MSKHRASTRIKFRILELLDGGPADKARIKYEAGLSTKQMTFYMPILIKNEYVEYVQNTRLYNIREKGRKLLEARCDSESTELA